MNTARRCALFVCLASIVLAGTSSKADWPSDPAVNLPIADRSGEQAIPLVGSTSDGGSYVAWFDNSTGSYQVWLQRLSAQGVEQWAHNGILVSDHAQNSALFGWDMIVDSSDNAVLVFSDIRDGGDLDTFAYRVSPGGALLWGPDGVQLSVNPDFDPAPRVAEASNGDFVFVWQRDPSSGDGDIRMQRLTAAGVPLMPAGGLPVVVSAGEDPGFVQIVPAENGNVILSWYRNIRSFSSPRHLRARKYAPDGTPVWAANTEVFNAFSLPIGYFPILQADGNGGAVLAWHRSNGSTYSCFYQHLNASGVELFAHNGVEVSTTGGVYHINPTLAYNRSSGEAFMFWNEENTLQSQFGLYAQKFSAAGVRQWGDGGAVLLSVDSVFKSIPRAVPYADGAMVFLYDQPGGFGTDRLFGTRVDGAGSPVWSPAQSVISSVASSKSRYPVTIASSGVVTLAWEDNRSGNVDVYGQAIQADGKVGTTAAIPGDVGATLFVSRSVITPGDLTLAWGGSCSATATNYAIYEGDIGSFASHVKKDCLDDGGNRTEEVTPRAGSAYYLVVPLTGTDEGSYGKTSANAERPAPAPPDRCLASQSLVSCAP